MTCRLCGATARSLAARADVVIGVCSVCRFVSGFPARPGNAAERYAGYHHGEEPAVPAFRYHQWLQKAEAGAGPRRLLEVGAGRGAFVRVARERGWEAWATEVSASGLEELRKTGAQVVAGELRPAGLPAGHFDLLVCLEVIEHVPEPLPLLEEMCRLTRVGGRLLLTTPNFGGLSRRWLGVGWRVIAPEHVGYFTPGTLRAAARRAGYRHVQVMSRGLDVTTWRGSQRGTAPAPFDPMASAALRDRVEGSSLLRAAKAALNAGLRLTGTGDSLLAWAQK